MKKREAIMQEREGEGRKRKLRKNGVWGELGRMGEGKGRQVMGAYSSFMHR